MVWAVKIDHSFRGVGPEISELGWYGHVGPMHLELALEAGVETGTHPMYLR